MIETLICGYNIFCHLHTLHDGMESHRYPPDVVMLCTYFEEQKVKLPDYCFYKTEMKIPRRRSEF
jgi:hypothetical protein